MILHLLRCHGIAVADYSFTPGRLEAAASSTFATSELIAVFFTVIEKFNHIHSIRHRPTLIDADFFLF